MSWRDMGRTVQIRGIGDARVIFPIVIFIFFYSWTTFLISAASILILMFMRFKGYGFTTLLRWMRSSIAGKRRLGRINLMKRRLYDQ